MEEESGRVKGRVEREEKGKNQGGVKDIESGKEEGCKWRQVEKKHEVEKEEEALMWRE